MSEVINNREYRQKVLRELIMELHNGKSVDEVKARFEKLIEGVSPSEISEMEQSLIMEGMPLEEVQRLCDVHAAVFKGSIEDIHKTPSSPDQAPGHPVHTFKLENRKLERLIDGTIKNQLEELKASPDKGRAEILLESWNLLWNIDKHYSRKENLIFPYLEKYEITAPPKVMWGVDDEIRASIKEVRSMLENYEGKNDELIQKAEDVLNRIKEMIFKEENILFPMAMETLTEDEWLSIAQESDEIGYCLTSPAGVWKPERANILEETKAGDKNDGAIRFNTGVLTVDEIIGVLNTLPVDITFVDKNGLVKYFSEGKERIFARTKAVIGRHVTNCHPPASVHIVEKIVEDFMSGKKDHEDFWIKMGDLFVYIRYFAVRDKNGEYMGTLEVTQNIKPIQELQGEKRLMSE